MQKIVARLANFGWGIVCRFAFSPSYSRDRLRKNFDRLAGISIKKLKKEFPKSEFRSVRLGNCKAEIITASDSPSWNLFYLHGGGYFMGSIHSYRASALEMAHQLDAKVFLLDYRLCPENPYPAGLDDAVSAYKMIQESYSDLPLLIGGDSAGGGLALALLLKLRDEKISLPKGAFLMSPWTDLLGSGTSMTANRARDVWLSKEQLDSWSAWYAGNANKSHPYLSPHFGDFSGICPLMVFAGDQEVLSDDAIRLFASEKNQNAKSKLFIGQQMQHVWILLLPFLRESKNAWTALKSFVSELK
ncbi:MAG: hypothetical protein JWQ35_1201 [Bacteriovoracaceae bacterium]|nr:hypothetical protein [Bacteriovoracaceae bacterium]